MTALGGFMPPYTPSGRSALVPTMPWHYSGTLLTVEYRTDPAKVRALLPAEVDLADEDPGAVAFIWADWQSCSAEGRELLDPSRSQYLETFAVVRCAFQGTTYSRCVLIWVTTDFAIGRGWFQGYPKKLGSIYVTRAMNHGKAAPRVAPGGTFGATLAAYDHRLATAKVTLREPSDTSGFVNALPMLHHRTMPSIAGG
ncbi:MAG: acetoacetate decarboxylase family protein, partial [Actinomycetales bacterium]